ncbi:Zn-dependent alcohol dehydrogenase [Streptomyces sp. NPDC096311]|uniref:Zn-dependent alcohol dehydrogenase n=1 Tax=Streptomyces sp. NPDC096311 TaxID=3366083 RepID=UPI00380A0F54
MRAAVMESQGSPLVVRELSPREPGPREVVVRLTASGVCHTDLSVLNGVLNVPAPAVLGHEGAGIVERVGSAVTGVRPGDRVVTAAAGCCDECYYCVRGETHNCDEIAARTVMPRFLAQDGAEPQELLGLAGLGTFAELMTVHESSVVPVRTELPDEQLALVGCGVVTGFGAVVNTARVEPGTTVAVIGCGGVGQAAVQAAVVSGAACVVAIDPVESRRASALHVGASVALAPDADLDKAIAELTEGRGADVAIEAVGSAETVMTAWRATRRGGTVVVVGAAAQSQQVTLSADDIIHSRKTLKGSIFAGGAARKLIPEIVRLAEAGRLDLASMVSRTIRLDQIDAAFEDMRHGRGTRSVVVYGDSDGED